MTIFDLAVKQVKVKLGSLFEQTTYDGPESPVLHVHTKFCGNLSTGHREENF